MGEFKRSDVKRYSTFPEWTEKVDEFCCICLTPFATTTLKRKRKKFHGASCENSARKILTEEILNELTDKHKPNNTTAFVI